MEKAVSLNITPMTKSCQVLPLFCDLWMISAVFTLALIAIEPKKKKITEFPIVSFVNALMSTLFDEIKASVNDIPTCVVHFKILFVWYIVVSDNWTGTFRSSWLSNNGKFQGYANCGSSAQLFSLLSYQLSQFIVDKARLWEPPRAACTI